MYGTYTGRVLNQQNLQDLEFIQMNTFKQHIPAFVDVDSPPVQNFETTQELLALEIVQRYVKDKGFSHFAMSGNLLMKICDEGYRWWVVGRIGDPSSIDLPKWDGGKYRAQLPNGDVVELTGQDVYSSCGDELTLHDGTKAKEIHHK